MFNRLAIRNFKSIGEPGVELDLKPLTILVGPNGAGKSNILEALDIYRPSGQYGNTQLSRDELIHRKDSSKEVVVEGSLTDGRGYETSSGITTEKVRVKTGDQYIDTETDPDSYYPLLRDLQTHLGENIFFISAFRGDVPREISPTNAIVNWTGPRGENLLYVLNQLNEPENLDKKRKVEHWAGEFGIKDLWSGLRGQVLQLMYRENGVLLAGLLASYGARQILAIIANLFYCSPERVFLIEEPESSLHPESQVKLVDMFADVVRDGNQIITTTHSSLLMLALNRPISKGVLGSDDVAVYDVSKDENGTHVAPLSLTTEGYISGWIPSFHQVEQELLGEWMQTRPEA